MRTEESADNTDSNHSEPTIGHVQSWCRGLLEAGDADDPIREANDPNSVISENTFFQVSPHTLSLTICMYETLSTIQYTIYLLTAIGLTPSSSSTVHIDTHTHNTQNNTINNLTGKSAGRAPSLSTSTMAFALQPRKEHEQTSVRVAEVCQLACENRIHRTEHT